MQQKLASIVCDRSREIEDRCSCKAILIWSYRAFAIKPRKWQLRLGYLEHFSSLSHPNYTLETLMAPYQLDVGKSHKEERKITQFGGSPRWVHVFFFVSTLRYVVFFRAFLVVVPHPLTILCTALRNTVWSLYYHHIALSL